MDQVFENLDCAASFDVALEFLLRKIKTDEFPYFYASEINILLNKSMLLCTKADVTNILKKVKSKISLKFVDERDKIQNGDSSWSLI